MFSFSFTTYIERGRTENSVRKTSSNGNNNTVKRSARNGRGWVSERSNVSSVRNGVRGRVGKSSGLLASGRRTSRYGGFSSNGNNNNKRSARNIQGWVSERNDVSSVRNFRSVRNGNGIRGRVESSQGWARGRTENSVRKTRGRGRVGKSGGWVSERNCLLYTSPSPRD